METVVTESEQETLDLARRWSSSMGSGDVVLLFGDLGAGKTQFAKGVASTLGLDPNEVTSPTFPLVREYETDRGYPLYHFDFYRIDVPEEALEIGVEEYFYGDGLSLVEWPEKIGPYLPEDRIEIRIDSGEGSRRIWHRTDTQQKTSA